MADLESIQKKIIVFKTERKWAQVQNPLPRYSFTLTSCAIPISYRDAVTYKNLTDLKAEAMTLVETFDTKPVAENAAAIENIMLEFRKAREFWSERGERIRYII